MNVKEFAIQLKEAIRSIKEKHGVDAIKCDNLLSYLDQIINSPGTDIDQTRLEQYKAELQLWVEQNKVQHAWDLEMFRSVILAGQNALKTAFLMNGGATVALLAFIGKLSDQHQDKIAIFANSLLIFVTGVLLIVMASGGTYLSQWFYAKPKCEKVGVVLNIFVVLLGLASYGFFIWGTIVAYKAFIGFDPHIARFKKIAIFMKNSLLKVSIKYRRDNRIITTPLWRQYCNFFEVSYT